MDRDQLLSSAAQDCTAIARLAQAAAPATPVPSCPAWTLLELPLSRLVDRTSVPQQTVSREVDRLVDAGFVSDRRLGGMRLVRANRDGMYFDERVVLDAAQGHWARARVAAGVAGDPVEAATCTGRGHAATSVRPGRSRRTWTFSWSVTSMSIG